MLLTNTELRKLIRIREKKAGGTQALANELSVTDVYIHRVKRGEIGAGPKLLAGLGVEKVVRYKLLGKGVDNEIR